MEELTDRERKMLKALAAGASNKELVSEFGIALRTIELCRSAIMRKMGAKSATQLGYKYAKMVEAESGRQNGKAP